MTDAMKPCPFCGGEAILEPCGVRWSVGCTEKEGADFCMGYQSLTTFSRQAEAIAAWNRRAPVEGQWRPIESAPKDGTVVDLFARSAGFSAGPGRIPECWFSDGRWWRWDSQYGDDQCRSRVSNVTHWQPLPPPPGQGEGSPRPGDHQGEKL